MERPVSPRSTRFSFLPAPGKEGKLGTLKLNTEAIAMTPTVGVDWVESQCTPKRNGIEY